MAVYGQYETVSEISRSGASTVSRARLADGGWDLGFDALGSDANFVVKAFHARGAGESEGGAETARFLERVAAQKRVVELGAKHWAPILASGVSGSDTYYVQHYYPLSATQLARSHAPIDASTLYAVASGSLAGLLEMRRALSRPHGNLKSGNVLIKGHGPLSAGDILLSDPAVQQDASIAGEVEDLFNLGEILHEVVTGERFAGQHTWPAPMTQAWANLGKNAERWLALCNHLLSPRAAENWLRVDDIIDEVDILRPRTNRLRSRKLWAAVATLAVIAGLGAGEYAHHANQWRELCTAYDAWAGTLSAQLSQGNAAVPIAQDAYLKEHLLGALDEARRTGTELDPRRIAGSNEPLVSLADHPPLGFGAIWNTEKAARVVNGIDRSLSVGHWQALDELNRRRADYQKFGWPHLTQYTVSVIEASPAPGRRDWLAAITSVLQGNAALTRLDAARAAARSRLDHLVVRAAGAPVIRDRIGEYEAILRVSADSDALLPTAPSVEQLSRQLKEAEQTVARFDDAVPLLAEAVKRQRAYEVRGWLGPARSIGALLERSRPGGRFEELPDQLAATKRAWDKAESEWGQIESRRRLLEMSGDPIPGTYRGFVAQAKLGEAPDVPSLTRKLEAINDDPIWAAVARKIQSPEWQVVDVPEFAQKSAAHRAFAGKTLASTADLKAWLTEVDGYGSQLASATMHPDGSAAKPVIVTAPRTPTTVASASPSTQKTSLAQAHPPASAPTTIASANPKSPTTMASAVKRTGPTTLASVPPAVDPEKLRIERQRELRAKEMAAFVAECREVAIKATNRDVKDAWRDVNNQIATRLQKDPVQYGPKLKAWRDTLRGRLLQLDSAYQSATAPLAIKAPPGAWGAALVKALQASAPSRAEELKELIGQATSGDARFESTLRELDDLDTQWRGGAAHVVADAQRVESLLNQGYMPGVKSPDSAALTTALNALRSAELYQNAGVRQALEPLMRPVTIVESEGNAPSAMRLLAESSDQPLGIRLAAWFKSGQDVSAQTLEQDLKVGDALLSAARTSTAQKPRVDWIKSSLESEIRVRWEALLTGARRAADVEAAMAMRDKISGVEIDRLAPAAQFNFALRDLRLAVASAKGDDALRTLEPAIGKLKAVVAALPADRRAEPAVAGLIGEVERVGQETAADLTQLGPASPAAKASADKVAWSPSVDRAGEAVSYRAILTTDAGKQDVTLVFRRVKPSAGGAASWVSTTEVSVGFFTDLVSAANRWDTFHKAKVLAEYDSPRGDPRVGPRAWDWTQYGKGMKGAMAWLGRELPLGAAHYPPGIASEFNPTQIGNPSNGERSEEFNPSRRQPMQYVSARGAMLAAALAGCRLPTVAEWQAANKSLEKHMGVNLRDRTWRLELDHMKKPIFGGRCRPDAGMFVPAGEKPSDEIWPRGDGTELNDGVLWFREVPVSPRPPDVFVDLIGNVGEFVTDGAGKVCVIGGSALSPPTRPTDKPFAVGAEQGGIGFSDVGFRLAFSEPAPGIDKLRELVAGDWYLTAK